MSNTHPNPRPLAPDRPRPARPASVVSPIRMREVPRPGGGTRRIALLPEADGRAYEAVVSCTLPFVERATGPEVFADRAEIRGGRIELRDWRIARRCLRHATHQMLRAMPEGATLIMDVRACYASIEASRVAAALRRLGAGEGDVARIVNQLRSFRERGVDGLPVGPVGSTVLANAVLHEVDCTIRAIGLPHTRWVDDLTVFAADRVSATRTCSHISRTLESLGLTVNEDKTRILSNRSAAAYLLGRKPSPAAGASSVA